MIPTPNGISVLYMVSLMLIPTSGGVDVPNCYGKNGKNIYAKLKDNIHTKLSKK